MIEWVFLALLAGFTVAAMRWLVRWYHACTFPDSNAPSGKKTDWRMFFFGRRR